MVGQAIEGRHYSQAVWLHKQSLESLLRYKCEKEIPDLPTDVMKKLKTRICIPHSNSKYNIYAWMVDFARTIIKKQWHNGKEGCWLHSRFFLIIIPNFRVQGKKHQITFASSSWSFTFLSCIQSSDQHHVELTNL